MLCVRRAAPPASFTRSCPASGGVLHRAESAKSEVRLIPGPNPNPRQAARPPTAVLHAALRRCALLRSINEPRARTPPSPRAAGLCAAVSDCSALDDGQRRSRSFTRPFALRRGFDARLDASQLRNALQRAARWGQCSPQ